jgi:hypothetical protein
MADDKRNREKQARDADRRQREREIAEELARAEEPEPPVEPADLAAVESALEPVQFPATGPEVVSAVGDRVVESATGQYAVEELVPATDAATFESPAAVRERIQRPTIAAAMKRVTEAAETVPHTELSGSRREAYEKTVRELKAIDADDDDEGIAVVRDWIVEQIDEENSLPGSRAVRRRAATFCRANGYEVRNDEWLGV